MPISNPIPKNSMFATPKDMNEILDLVESIPSSNGARAAAMTAVMMTLNLASEGFDRVIAAERVSSNVHPSKE